MRAYIEEIFRSIFDDGGALGIEHMSFERCAFARCLLSLTTQIERRSIVRDVHLRDCESFGCDIGPAILEDCSVHNLEIDDILICWGTLFKHVTLSGEIGEMKVNQQASVSVFRNPELQAPFDAFRERYYESVDWALDISQARFKDFDARGIPARLFKLDLETQAIVTRERALQSGWRERVSSWNDVWLLAVDMMLKDGDSDTILVAPLLAPKEERDLLMRGIRELRDLAVAEPI